jgi:hypothetical protein
MNGPFWLICGSLILALLVYRFYRQRSMRGFRGKKFAGEAIVARHGFLPASKPRWVEKETLRLKP